MTRVAAIQMCSTPDRTKNLLLAEALLKTAVQEGAEWVAFPENFSLLTEKRKALFDLADPNLDGPTVTQIREWAERHKVWILAGSVPLRVPGDDHLVTNTSLWIDPRGQVAARYDKIHLFDVCLSDDRPYEESKMFKPGAKPVSASTPFGQVGLSICYDLRFPELYRQLSSEVVIDVFFIPAAFTKLTGAAHWDLLTRARAVENQAYVIAPAQWGSPYDGRETYGHTRVIDPWGRVLAEQPNGNKAIIADLDREVLEKIRRELPSLQHRRI